MENCPKSQRSRLQSLRGFRKKNQPSLIMSKPGNVRTFICVELPDVVHSQLANLQCILKKFGADVGWVKPSNIHLTLKFLGDVPEQKITEVCSAVENSAIKVSPFELLVKGTGCFPSARNPRVIWVGINPFPGELRQLQKLIDGELFTKGYSREDRPFSPHLTLGRVRSPHNVQALVRKMEEMNFQGETIWVKEVTVMRSDLRPTGAQYASIRVYQLKGGKEDTAGSSNARNDDVGVS